MFPVQPGMPHGMVPRPPQMQPGMPMSQPGPGPMDKKDMMHPSGMSELQKLVNMQTQVAPPDMPMRGSASGGMPMPSPGLTSTAQAIMASSPGLVAKPGEVRIPATQPVPPQLSTAIDGARPDGEGMPSAECEMARPLPPGEAEAKSNQNVLLKQLLNMRKQGQGEPGATIAGAPLAVRRMSEVSMVSSVNA